MKRMRTNQLERDKMKRTRWIGAVIMTALLIAVSGVAAVMLWAG